MARHGRTSEEQKAGLLTWRARSVNRYSEGQMVEEGGDPISLSPKRKLQESDLEEISTSDISEVMGVVRQ